MAETTIEWTEKTWNPVVGCTWASAGCDHCYAATMTRRLEAMGQADYAGLTTAKHFNGVVRPLARKLDAPLRWRKPRMVFVNSMSDLFHKDVPFEFSAAVFGVMAASPQHTFQVLTKRADRMAEFCKWIGDNGGIGRFVRSDSGRHALRPIFGAVQKTEIIHGTRVRALSDPWMRVMSGAACNYGDGPLTNVWLGVSVESQEQLHRVEKLAECPAAVRFVSAEPLIGPIDFWPYMPSPEHGPGIEPSPLSWVIVGGESGHGARPCNVAWIRSIRDQCKAAGVACFVKQLGFHAYDGAKPLPLTAPMGFKEIENMIRLKDKKGGDMAEWPEDLRVREFPNA